MRARRALISAALALLIALAAAGYILHLPGVVFEEVSLKLKFQYDYVLKAYRPRWLSRGEVGSYPTRYSIAGVPWISYNKSYCAATCLQMVAYKYGVREPIEYFNFIMGFTYGAYLGSFEGEVYFIPGGNPFTGYVNASEALGFEHHLLVTNDRELFIDACRYIVSRDIPVILPVNMSRLYHLKWFAPHFELVVGYDEDGFYIYEPVQPKQVFELGRQGLKFPTDLVVRAVEDMSKGFNLPWKYSFIYFTRRGEPVKDLRRFLADNGRLQVGCNITLDGGTFYLGSYAVNALADYIGKGKVRPEAMAWSILLAMTSRKDNAGFLKERFKGDELVSRAANYLEKASELYREVYQIIKDGATPEEVGEVVNLLKKASVYEREAGLLMIEAGS